MDQEQHAEDFFLPDLCEAQSILFLILVTELLVFVLVLADSELIDFNWVQLGLTSLFVQWIVLTSAGILCHFRPILMRLSVAAATTICYGLILSMTFGFSLLGEWLFLPEVGGWSVEALGRTGRNLLIASVMTGIAFRYFYLQHQFRRQEQAELNSRIQALQSRIRPHFLFNSMNIIASLISVDPAMAEEVVEDLSLLFRASLNDTSDKPVLLSEELELCEKYVHIESLRLDDRLKVDWQVNVDIDRVRIPMLTLQPLLENAIYHGIQPLPGGGVVTVNIVEKNEYLIVTITNPLPPKTSSSLQGNRMALDNIRRRIQAIYGLDGTLKSESGDTTFRTTVSYPLLEPTQ